MKLIESDWRGHPASPPAPAGRENAGAGARVPRTGFSAFLIGRGHPASRAGLEQCPAGSSPVRRRRRSSGTELVEFAVVLPALVLLMLVIGEVSGAVGAYQIIDNAAREGARLAVVPGESGATSDIQNRVIAYASANGITLTTSDISINQAEIVSPTGAACSATNPCITASKVSVTYSYPVNVLLGSTFNLGASVEMRNLY